MSIVISQGQTSTSFQYSDNPEQAALYLQCPQPFQMPWLLSERSHSSLGGLPSLSRQM